MRSSGLSSASLDRSIPSIYWLCNQDDWLSVCCCRAPCTSMPSRRSRRSQTPHGHYFILIKAKHKRSIRSGRAALAERACVRSSWKLTEIRGPRSQLGRSNREPCNCIFFFFLPPHPDIWRVSFALIRHESFSEYDKREFFFFFSFIPFFFFFCLFFYFFNLTLCEV